MKKVVSFFKRIVPFLKRIKDVKRIFNAKKRLRAEICQLKDANELLTSQFDKFIQTIAQVCYIEVRPIENDVYFTTRTQCSEKNQVIVYGKFFFYLGQMSYTINKQKIELSAFKIADSKNFSVVLKVLVSEAQNKGLLTITGIIPVEPEQLNIMNKLFKDNGFSAQNFMSNKLQITYNLH
jgi:hypothetical protein